MVALLPLMVVSRLLLGRKTPGGSEPATRPCQSEFAPQRGINALLRAPVEIEVALTLAGVRLPIGGSRIVVARKR
jgi:hypothetical protein